MQPRILVVDDDKSDRLFARKALEKQDYFIFEAINGQRLAEILKDYTVDLILLDLKLPGEDGLSLISTIRHKTNAPIIVVSGLQTISDKKISLDSGADDYITKPFFAEELQARIKANLRRYRDTPAEHASHTKIEFGDWILDRTVFDAVNPQGMSAALTMHEFKVLERLILAQGRVLTRADLSDMPCRRGVDVQITRIRKKLGLDGLIKTVRGIGYRFDGPIRFLEQEG